MPKSPLGNLPLSVSPYNSRINSEYGSEDKNYYLIGFNPGYALQASELNELQELFFLNQTLTQKFNLFWSRSSYSITHWDGLVPLNHYYVASTEPQPSEDGTISLNVNISQGWYLWTDSESKLSFWIYNKNTYSSEPFTTSGNAEEYIGFEVEKELILCCPTADCSDTQDQTLRDNSSGSTENFFTCGASRLKATIGDLVIRNAIASNFYPILKITRTLTGQGYKAEVTFFDDQPVIKV